MFSTIQRLDNYCHLPLNELKHSGKPRDAFPTSDKIKTIADRFGLAQWLVVLASSKWLHKNWLFLYWEQLYFKMKVLCLFVKSWVSIKSYWCSIYCVRKYRETVKLFCCAVNWCTMCSMETWFADLHTSFSHTQTGLLTTSWRFHDQSWELATSMSSIAACVL